MNEHGCIPAKLIYKNSPGIQSDISKNSGVSAFENIPSIKATLKLATVVRISFLRTPESNQRCAAIRGAFIQEKELNRGKNNESYGILACPSPTISSPA